MSVVTGITLITGVLDDKIASDFRALLQQWKNGWSLSKNLTIYSGGGWGPQCLIYSGGLNHLSTDDKEQLVEWLTRQDWYSAREVCVVFNFEEASLEIYRMDGEKIVNDYQGVCGNRLGFS